LFIFLQDAGEALDGALGGGRAVWLEDTEVVEPSTAVELGEDGVDEEGLGGVLVAVGLGLDDDDAGHGLLGGGDGARSRRTPADDDGAAGVPEVEDLEWDRGLAALAGDELGAGGEGGRAESDWAGAAGVDELDDGVRVVGEALGHGGLRQGGVELFVDQGAEVLGDLDGVLGGHARLSSLDQGGGDGACGKETGDDEAAHLD